MSEAGYQDLSLSTTMPSMEEIPALRRELRTTIDTLETNEQLLSTNESVEAQDALAKVPRRKVSITQYRLQKARQEIGARAKPVYFGQNELEPVLLDFGDITNGQDSPWKREFNNLDKVVFRHICIAQDLQAQQGYIQRRTIFRGSLLAADAENQETAKVLEKVRDELVVRSAGLLASLPTFAIVLFPALRDEWSYLEASSDFPTEGQLRYLVFELDRDINQFHSDEIKKMGFGEPCRKLLIEMIHGLNIKRLIPLSGCSQDPHKYFLLFPNTAKHISCFLATWIKEQIPQCKIYDSQKAGSWDFFRKNFHTGVVLVHETAAADLYLLPDLFETLRKKDFSFWCISSGDTVYPLYPSQCYGVDQSSLGQISATRLFPQGCAMLLTPSFLVAEPKRAYDLAKTFKIKNEAAMPGTWKLVCAANICNYLLDLAISKVDEKDALEIANRDVPAKDAILNDAGLSFTHCETRIKLHTFFAHLGAKGLIASPTDSGSIDMEHFLHGGKESHIIQADTFVDPDDEPALIEWFAAWTMRNLDVHRKFIVVGTGPTSAPRAHRMKETVHIFDLANTSNSGTVPGAKAVDTTKEAKRTALGIAAKLNALQQDRTVMTISSGSEQNDMLPGELATHGVNDSPTHDLRRFSGATGSSADNAINSLIKPDDDLKTALEDTDAMDLDAQISELIASVASGTNSPAPLRIVTTENDQAQAREDGATATPPISATTFSAITSAFPPQFDGTNDAYSPQYDGADDRPMSSGSGSTTRSGIATNEKGIRFVPRSVRPDNSVRKEIPVRPGFIPKEDIERYVSPNVASRGPSCIASVRSSATPPPAAARTRAPVEQDLGSDPMDIDDDNTGMIIEKDNGSGANPPTVKAGIGAESEHQMDTPKNPNVQIRKHISKDTVAWYDEYKRTNGSGWEHIFIGGFEDAIKKSGVAPSK